MKLALALLSTAFAAIHAKSVEISSVKADSKFGMHLLSKARQLEQNGGAEADQTWMADYSLKFIGCHHISQWNGDVDDADEVRIESVRLARFRLCPTSSCVNNHNMGCSSSYGDYVVDMDEFLVTYLENKEEVIQQQCETYAQYNCNCENYYGDEQQCEYNCFMSGGMSECVDEQANQNQNAYGYNQFEFDLNDYLECAQYQPQNNNNRRLDGADEEVEYYIGTYCASQGGSVVLGMFTDDACTNFADYNGGRTTFFNLEGKSLPYSDSSIIDDECYACGEAGEANQYGYQEMEVKEACGNVYTVAGKCETALSGYNSYPNENACQYISGIAVTSANGIINSAGGSSNKVADAFIGIFACSFVLLGSYVYYLKTKLDRGKINLSD
mmetsp:Transcript_4288/g.5266  ORF Transcript_4288/g.5266 Transcript_4288/m.5266 type:complete len:385 (-) Transcript_4288:282-1436(-)